MNHLLPVLAAVLAALLLSCAEPVPDPGQPATSEGEKEPEGSHSRALEPPPSDGFLDLFNGENLDGWTVMGSPAGWLVENGVLRSEGGKGGAWLRFNEPLSDFLLKVDWRVSKNGNSGVFIRAHEEGNPWETGYEIQISNERRDDLHCTCSLYDYAAVDFRPDETPEIWHTFEIHASGTRITIYSDGKKCLDVDQAEKERMREKPLKGFLGMQDSHAGEGSYVEYRNIRLQLGSSGMLQDDER